MSTTTIGTATEPRPTSDTPSAAFATTAERRARTLAPTIFCPSAEVDECLERSQAGWAS